MSSGDKFSSANDNYYDAGDEVGFATTPDSGVHEAFEALTPEEKAEQEKEWKEQLAKTEDEILTLRQVLSAKIRESQDLKRKLGVTVWKEFKEDLDQGIKVVRDTEVMQKTETVVKSVAEKTTTVFGAIGSSVSRKFVDVRNSSTFKNFEENVSSVYGNVKEKVSGSRSSSTQNFEDALLVNEQNSATETVSSAPVLDTKLPK